MSIFRSIIIVVLVLITAFLTVGGYFYYELTRPLLTQGMIVEIKAGDQKARFADQLGQLGLTPYPRVFAAYMYMQRQTIKRGEYWFQPASSLYSIWQQVSRGTGFYYRSFTIVPGWTIQQLRQSMLSTDTLRHVAAYQDDATWSKTLGLATIPEGLLLPETYFYLKGTSDWVVLHAAKHLMDVKLAELWAHRASDLPFHSPYEALIAASLIEKEAYHNDERSVIAGVLVNRIKKNMLLQFDPTVIYGLGAKYDGTLHKKDLQENTPYNTYMNKGLPPTPIALPSLKSIEAALHPSQHEYLYFVVEGEKRHRFSTTLSMHHEAVKSYRQQEKQK